MKKKINYKKCSLNIKFVKCDKEYFVLLKNSFRIYTNVVHLKSKIKDGDRIEIYRNITIDPKA